MPGWQSGLLQRSRMRRDKISSTLTLTLPLKSKRKPCPCGSLVRIQVRALYVWVIYISKKGNANIDFHLIVQMTKILYF